MAVPYLVRSIFSLFPQRQHGTGRRGLPLMRGLWGLVNPAEPGSPLTPMQMPPVGPEKPQPTCLLLAHPESPEIYSPGWFLSSKEGHLRPHLIYKSLVSNLE